MRHPVGTKCIIFVEIRLQKLNRTGIIFTEIQNYKLIKFNIYHYIDSQSEHHNLTCKEHPKSPMPKTLSCWVIKPSQNHITMKKKTVAPLTSINKPQTPLQESPDPKPDSNPESPLTMSIQLETLTFSWTILKKSWRTTWSGQSKHKKMNQNSLINSKISKPQNTFGLDVQTQEFQPTKLLD